MWNIGKLGVTKVWNDIVFGNGLFVVVGNGVSMVSNNGKQWNIVDLSYNLLSITYANNCFYAITSTLLLTCVDGVSWEICKELSFDCKLVYWVNDVIMIGDYCVYIGDNRFECVDLINVKAVISSPFVLMILCDHVIVSFVLSSCSFNVYYLPLGTWCDISYGNRCFVAVSKEGDMIVSDGIIFTHYTTPYMVRTITFGNGLFESIGKDFVTSLDGIEWTKRSIPGYEWEHIIYGNNTFVTINKNEYMTASSMSINLTPSNLKPLLLENKYILGQTPIIIPKPDSNSDAIITYTSLNEGIIEIIDDHMKIIGIGKTIIIATQEDNEYYEGEKVSKEIEIVSDGLINVCNEEDLMYFMESDGKCGHVMCDLEIEDELIVSFKKQLTVNDVVYLVKKMY